MARREGFWTKKWLDFGLRTSKARFNRLMWSSLDDAKKAHAALYSLATKLYEMELDREADWINDLVSEAGRLSELIAEFEGMLEELEEG